MNPVRKPLATTNNQAPTPPANNVLQKALAIKALAKLIKDAKHLERREVAMIIEIVDRARE